MKLLDLFCCGGGASVMTFTTLHRPAKSLARQPRRMPVIGGLI